MLCAQSALQLSMLTCAVSELARDVYVMEEQRERLAKEHSATVSKMGCIAVTTAVCLGIPTMKGFAIDLSNREPLVATNAVISAFAALLTLVSAVKKHRLSAFKRTGDLMMTEGYFEHENQTYKRNCHDCWCAGNNSTTTSDQCTTCPKTCFVHYKIDDCQSTPKLCKHDDTWVLNGKPIAPSAVKLADVPFFFA